MSFILNIDTATEIASLCLAKNGEKVGLLINEDQKDHAAWIHVAIKQLLRNADLTIQQISAIAISAGPGSYTGLRVGMASAKGLCFAMNLPLITENTLEIMAFAAIENISQLQDQLSSTLICPMLDARRMEVFTAIFDKDRQQQLPSVALVLNEESFGQYLKENRMIFFGSGSKKWKQICNHPHAEFASIAYDASHLAQLSVKKFNERNFADIVYTEPLYLKEFYTHNKK